MLITFGVYRFRPKRVAFRNDYCLSCRQARRSVQIRSFDAVNILWIPIIPLGFQKRWICTACGRRPDASVKTRRPLIWAGMFVLVALSMISWGAPVDPAFVVGTWAVRVGGPLGAIFVLVHLLRTPKDPSRKERLKTISPAADTTCPFCGAHLLILGSQCSCPACGVVRL